MNIETLISDLSQFGTVEFCNYNTPEKLNFIISVSSVANDFNSEISIKQSIVNNCNTEFSKFEHYSLDNGNLKIQLAK